MRGKKRKRQRLVSSLRPFSYLAVTVSEEKGRFAFFPASLLHRSRAWTSYRTINHLPDQQQQQQRQRGPLSSPALQPLGILCVCASDRGALTGAKWSRASAPLCSALRVRRVQQAFAKEGRRRPRAPPAHLTSSAPGIGAFLLKSRHMPEQPQFKEKNNKNDLKETDK